MSKCFFIDLWKVNINILGQGFLHGTITNLFYCSNKYELQLLLRLKRILKIIFM